MEIEMFELRALLKDAADHAVKLYRVERGEERPFISLRKAHKLYGRFTVENWIKSGLIKRYKDNNGRTNTIRIDKIELDRVAKSSNNY